MTQKRIQCAFPMCEETYPDHYWGAVKANDAGWFRQKDGRSWCPKHIPKYIASWRRLKVND
jgi:hypothetical protein